MRDNTAGQLDYRPLASLRFDRDQFNTIIEVWAIYGGPYCEDRSSAPVKVRERPSILGCSCMIACGNSSLVIWLSIPSIWGVFLYDPKSCCYIIGNFDVL